MKSNRNVKYWAVLEEQADGKLKVKKASKYTVVNQYVRTWEPTNSRNLARTIKNNGLVTR